MASRRMLGIFQTAGSADANPANDAANSGTSSQMPCTMSNTMNGTRESTAIFCAFWRDCAMDASTSSTACSAMKALSSSPAAAYR